MRWINCGPACIADLDSDPVAAFWADELMVARVKRVGFALEKGGKSERDRAPEIQRSLSLAPDAAHAALMKHLMTAGKRRKKQATKELEKALGAELDTYLRDLDTLETALETITAIQTDIRIWALNRHGLLLGHALLGGYQDAKAQQGVIDFADAEWLACRLLQSEEHAPGLALKLDARYRHLLLDEFQDTNPLQWQALSTWLAEARAADSDMTVFMVGDPKQAIYRFRRGEARVFTAAADFLHTHFDAPLFSTTMTRRLSPAVVQAINPVFAGVVGFAEHTARAGQRIPPRRVALSAGPRGKSRATPLPTACAIRSPRRGRSRRHARCTSRRRPLPAMLRDEVLGRWSVVDRHTKNSRPARPGDVMALVRKRTHLHLYERALEAAGIPFITSRRGGLLHALEAQDVITLFETLLLPHADLKLAHTLKSPVFSCSDADLLAVFAPSLPDEPRGWERLLALAGQPDCAPTLTRAAQLLTRWRARIGTLPVHDLLDRIYFEGDLEARYAAAVPAAHAPAGRRQPARLHAAGADAGRRALPDAGRLHPRAGFAHRRRRRRAGRGAGGRRRKRGAAADHPRRQGAGSADRLAARRQRPRARRQLWRAGAVAARSAAARALFPVRQAGRAGHLARALVCRGSRAGAARIRQPAVRGADPRRTGADRQRCRGQERLAAARRGGMARHGSAGRPAACGRATDEVPATAAPPRITAPAVGQRLPPAPANPAAASGELFHACLEHHAPPGAPRDLPALAHASGGDQPSLRASRPRPVPCWRSRIWRASSTLRSIGAPSTN